MSYNAVEDTDVKCIIKHVGHSDPFKSIDLLRNLLRVQNVPSLENGFKSRTEFEKNISTLLG